MTRWRGLRSGFFILGLGLCVATAFVAIDAAVERQPDPDVTSADYRQAFHATSLELLGSVDSGAGPVTKIAFSGDGSRLAAGHLTGVITVWDAASSARVRTITSAHRASHNIALSPDGRTLAATDQLPPIHLWEVETGRELKPLEEGNELIDAMVFSPDGRYLVSGGSDRVEDSWYRLLALAFYRCYIARSDRLIKVWDLQTGPRKRSYVGHKDEIDTIALSRDGHLLVSGSLDGSVRTWAFDTGKQRDLLEAGEQTVISVDLSADGRYLVYSAYNLSSRQEEKFEGLRVWDLSERRLQFSLSVPPPHRGVGFLLGGRLIVALDRRSLRLWSRETQRELMTVDLSRVSDPPFTMGVSPDGRSIALGTEGGRVIRLGLRKEAMKP